MCSPSHNGFNELDLLPTYAQSHLFHRFVEPIYHLLCLIGTSWQKYDVTSKAKSLRVISLIYMPFSSQSNDFIVHCDAAASSFGEGFVSYLGFNTAFQVKISFRQRIRHRASSVDQSVNDVPFIWFRLHVYYRSGDWMSIGNELWWFTDVSCQCFYLAKKFGTIMRAAKE